MRHEAVCDSPQLSHTYLLDEAESCMLIELVLKDWVGVLATEVRPVAREEEGQAYP